MAQLPINAIQAMVAPVVLITSAAILAGGISSMYGAVNDRMRAMTAERLDRLAGPSGSLLPLTDLSERASERIKEIDEQLPKLLDRHRLLRHAVLLCYAAVLILFMAVASIALAVTARWDVAAGAALVLVLVGNAILLLALGFAARSIVLSNNAIDYEVTRVLSLGR